MKNQPSESATTRQEFLASLFKAYSEARPLSFLRQWRPEDLLASGIPREWLEQNHLIKSDGETTNLPTYCSQREFASIVTQMFGKPVSQPAVSRAIQHEGMAVCVTASNGRIRTDSGLQWWRSNKTTGVEEVACEAEHRRERQRIAREREQLELDTIKRKFDAQWLTADAFEFFSGGFGATARNTALDLSERIQVASEGIISECVSDLAQRQSLIEKLRPIYASKFDEWQIEFCQRLEDLLKQGKEMSEKQKLEMK